mmetsp:Transcript_15245/g.32022  ORF Transcript_15245/g.32022 Transcript_15245/m.32022 type:complete len:290 (-) Transcript_15245:718-1587(-)
MPEQGLEAVGALPAQDRCQPRTTAKPLWPCLACVHRNPPDAEDELLEAARMRPPWRNVLDARCQLPGLCRHSLTRRRFLNDGACAARTGAPVTTSALGANLGIAVAVCLGSTTRQLRRWGSDEASAPRFAAKALLRGASFAKAATATLRIAKSEFFTLSNWLRSEETHSHFATDNPTLSVAIRGTRMVHETSRTTSLGRIDGDIGSQRHRVAPSPDITSGHDLAQVLCDEVTATELPCRSEPKALLWPCEVDLAVIIKGTGLCLSELAVAALTLCILPEGTILRGTLYT